MRRWSNSVRGLPAGFTLMEMLVTMVIVSMLAAILGQGLFQLSRIERRLQVSGTDSQRLLVRREWIRSLLESSLLDRMGKDLLFRGDEKVLEFASAEAFSMVGAQDGAMRLELRANPRQISRGELLLSPRKEADIFSSAEARPLLSWEGKAGTIRYLDDKGIWQPRWPVPNSTTPYRLPRLVLIDLSAEAGGPLLVAITNSETERYKLREWEQQ